MTTEEILNKLSEFPDDHPLIIVTILLAIANTCAGIVFGMNTFLVILGLLCLVSAIIFLFIKFVD